MWSERLAGLLKRNAVLRLFAVIMAIGLWLFVNTGQHEAQTSLEVPVSYRSLPRGLVMVNHHPDFVQLQVFGPRTLLSLLDPGRLELRLDLTGVAPGQASFRISPDMFNVPRQTSVTRISPSQIVLDIDRIATRELPVHLNLTGPVTDGFAIAGIDLKPATVTVSGPARDVSRLEQIESEPLDVKGVTDQVERDVALVIPPGPLRVSAAEVEARVRFEEAMRDREFRTVEVTVRDPAYKYRLYTRLVSLTIRGPVRKLSTLSLAGVVYVDARGAQPGLHELPVQVDLPDGLQVVRRSPNKVKLRILATKGGASS